VWKWFDVQSAWQTTLPVPITPGLSLRLRQFVQGSPRATKRWGIAFGGLPCWSPPSIAAARYPWGVPARCDGVHLESTASR
jgi:hypothetical protein